MLGLIVQMQITPEFGGAKVRFNLADPVVALLLPLIGYAAFFNWHKLKKEIGWQILLLFVCATVAFSYAYVIGFLKIGFFTWSAVKYAGWYALMAYLAVGVFFAALLGKAGQKTFALVYCGACVVISLVQIFLLYFTQGEIYLLVVRFEGFTGNPNAFGFVLICGFVLCSVYKDEIRGRFFKGSPELFCAIILAGIYFTGSISALLTTILVFGFLLNRIVSWKQLTVIVCLALVITFAPSATGAYKPKFSTAVLEGKIFFNLTTALKNKTKQDGTVGPDKSNKIYYQTIGVRIEAMGEAFELWQQSPAFGAGLGVHLFQQQNSVVEEQPVVIIHNTGLWLLAGTGLIGLMVFVLLFVALIKKMWANAKTTTEKHRPLQSGNFASAALICMVAWLFMSQFHELMYQRVIWLIVGLALWPVANRQNS